MTREEFLSLVNQRIEQEEYEISTISDEDFGAVETVLAFHPSFYVPCGRQLLADLYVSYGMPVIRDMLPRARFLKTSEQKLLSLRETLSALEKQVDSVRKGGSLPGPF